MNEAMFRESIVCMVCGSEKHEGALLCWGCFKHEAPCGITPLKWSGMSFTEWVAQF